MLDRRQSAHEVPVGPQFSPQRLYPRFAGPLNLASHLPGGLGLSSRLLRPISEHRFTSDFERATQAHLARAAVAITGFPRTGTTYLSFLVNAAYSSDSACWKNHDAFAFPQYVEAAVTAVLTLREPIGCVTSWSMYNSDEPSVWLMRKRLQTYCAWHRHVLRSTKDLPITIARFEEFTMDHTFLVGELSPKELGDSSTLEFDEDAFVDSTNQRHLPQQQRHLPSVERDAAKSAYQSIIRSSKLLPLLLSAEELHQELWERAGESARIIPGTVAVSAA